MQQLGAGEGKVQAVGEELLTVGLLREERVQVDEGDALFGGHSTGSRRVLAHSCVALHGNVRLGAIGQVHLVKVVRRGHQHHTVFGNADATVEVGDDGGQIAGVLLQWHVLPAGRLRLIGVIRAEENGDASDVISWETPEHLLLDQIAVAAVVAGEAAGNDIADSKGKRIG